MKRVVIEFRDGFVNIPADRMEIDENNMLRAYDGEQLVGLFEMDIILKAHISDRTELQFGQNQGKKQ